ncbi:hypothetical protein [Sulfitobacter sp. W074]|uniref:hypothetical protein n=1 Tax=Sulfitobacter sp. W074 TaxID=2867026 RepID=UPI0021A2A1CE|nr:hypothetical protein [Sulfitobacter sp. W074]UWR39483.1 hypothetical protein K3762_18160 [Sulfitobacter sp. W074]UWR39614.1 hypothetical protein K3762_19500 [Sulfitobacter sp. W074]
MKSLILGCIAVIAFTSSAAAQNIMAIYDARLDPHDLVNSSGQPLGSVCAAVQQDRANYHRFRKRGQADDSDPIFADKTMRARIAGNCAIMPGHEHLRKAVFSGIGYGIVVRVQVLNDAGTLKVLVSERAG